MNEPSENNIARIENYVAKNCERLGLQKHPQPDVTEGVIKGLAAHLDTLKRPLCPCQFYPDKAEAVAERTWICPCEDMRTYKFCHCLLFVNADGVPITEHLPEDHHGRASYGEVADPAADKGL